MLRALSFFLAGFLLQAQPQAKGPTFEVASIKLFGSDERKVTVFSGGPGSDDPGRLHLRVNMSLLLAAAFAVPVDQIKGPAWLRDFSAMPFYDIVATLPAATSKKQVEQMLQNLLAERFHLAFHQETVNFPGYELVVDKGGFKLKEVTPDPNPMVDAQTVRNAPMGADGFPVVRGPRTTSLRPGTVNQRIKDQESSMADFARQLGFLIGRAEGKSLDDGFYQPRVVDKTNLAGKYTFILEFDCPACGPVAPAVNPAGGNAAASMEESLGYPNIFAALPKQLGLRLVRAADVAMNVTFIDALNRVPTEN